MKHFKNLVLQNLWGWYWQSLFPLYEKKNWYQWYENKTWKHKLSFSFCFNVFLQIFFELQSFLFDHIFLSHTVLYFCTSNNLQILFIFIFAFLVQILWYLNECTLEEDPDQKLRVWYHLWFKVYKYHSLQISDLQLGRERLTGRAALQAGSWGEGQSTRVGGARAFCRQMLPLPKGQVEQTVAGTNFYI